MPKRKDIKKILIIGSGPIVIGQACEFDYSGAQACKALRAEGYKVILVNSNPATIMTDPELANRTYIEPLTKEYLEEIIAKEKPDALLPTVGGQTALNLAVELSEGGILEKYKVEMIGASLRAIKVAEDRLWFKDACRKIGLEVPASALVNNAQDALRLCDQLGFPLVIRPSFTLGGTGGSFVHDKTELDEALNRGLQASPIHEVLVEKRGDAGLIRKVSDLKMRGAERDIAAQQVRRIGCTATDWMSRKFFQEWKGKDPSEIGVRCQNGQAVSMFCMTNRALHTVRVQTVFLPLQKVS